MNDTFLDECPICYNAYRHPKGLPCFHTFCQECLQTHIDNNSVDGIYFNCPMCRKRTVPFGDIYTPVSEWAKSFPTNNYILNRYLEITQKQCPDHRNEILDINCKTCRVMICAQCCLSTHEKCEKTLTKFNMKRIKNSLLARLRSLKQELEPLEKRLDDLETNKNCTVNTVKEMSQELLSFVANQELFWLNEIEAMYLKESGNLQEQKENVTEVIDMAEANVNDIDNLLSNQDVVEDKSKSQPTFDYQPKHVLMSKADLFPSVEEVNFQVNETFIELKNELLKENMVLKIDESESSSVLNATNEGVSTLFLRELHFFPETLVGINDMVMLPDHCFLITEACFKKVWKFSIEGQHLQNLYFDSEPFGLCLLEENTVAISQPYDKKINIFNYINLVEKESFTFYKRYYGLGSDDNKRIFSLYRDQIMCVDILSKNNHQTAYEIIHVVRLPTMFFLCDDYRLRILPSGHILIINSATSLNVSCIDQIGMVVFVYEGHSDNNLQSISDIAVSNHFIYIADQATNKIHRIQHGGTFVDIPLTSNDGISQPKKIFANSEGILAILSKSNQNPRIQIFTN